MLRLTVPLVLCCAMAQAQNLGCTFDPNVDGYIEVPHSAQVVPRSGITVEAWFTYDDAALPSGWRYPTIMRQGIGPQGENIMLRVDADNSAQRELRWRIKTTSGATFDCNYLFAPGEFLVWTHVAGTYDGNTLALYINGQQVVSTATNGEAIRDVVDVLRIGKGSDVATPIEVWNGELDEVRLWQRWNLSLLPALAERCVEALADYEPYPVWQESFLRARAECYERTGNPLLATARRDVVRFETSEASGFWRAGEGPEPPRMPAAQRR